MSIASRPRVKVYLVQAVLLGRVLLLLDAEQVQHHGHREEDGGEEEEDLLLGFEGHPKESVRPVQASQRVTHGAAETCRQKLFVCLAESVCRTCC